jgi:hypothetical protein
MLIHKDLSQDQWFALSTIQQFANIGCDLDRAFRWKNKGDEGQFLKAFDRTWELLQLTIADPKNRKILHEACCLKEAIGSYFFGDNIYGYTEEALSAYFFNYNYMWALQRGKQR